MAIKTAIKRNTYFDSVSLMSVTGRANAVAGVDQAMIGMGTAMNKEVLQNVGMLTPEAAEARARMAYAALLSGICLAQTGLAPEANLMREPDLTVWFDLAPEVAAERLAGADLALGARAPAQLDQPADQGHLSGELGIGEGGVVVRPGLQVHRVVRPGREKVLPHPLGRERRERGHQ